MLGLGSLVQLDDDSTETLFSYIEAEIEEGIATASFVPAEYMEELLVNGANGSAQPLKERLEVSLFCQTTTLADDGHFIVYYYPFGKPYILKNSEDRRPLLADLEEIYEDYLAKGYTYEKREKWPMEVHVSP